MKMENLKAKQQRNFIKKLKNVKMMPKLNKLFYNLLFNIEKNKSKNIKISPVYLSQQDLFQKTIKNLLYYNQICNLNSK